MHLTPTILEAAYNYLRATPPFKNWKLPESDAVEFCVNEMKNYADYTYDYENPQKHRIRVSQKKCGKTPDLITTMAHEMCHTKQRMSDARSGYDSVSHGPKFKRLAAQVCKQHGFDVATF